MPTIENLPTGSTPGASDPLPTVQSGATKKITIQQAVDASTIVKGDVGLGSVDNTADADKPVSTAQRTALDAKPNRNLMINGNPIINQRGYVSGTATTGANEYTLDRWRVVTSGQHLTFSKTANVVTMTLPTGGIEQVIEDNNIQSGTYVISFTATGDTVCTVDGTTRASGDTFTLTGGTNAAVKFSSAAGTGTVKLVQIEAGSDVSSFEHRPYQIELALCQRYGFMMDDDQANAVFGLGFAVGTTRTNIIITPPTTLRVPPASATVTNITNFVLTDGVTTRACTNIFLSGDSMRKDMVEIIADVASGLTQFRPYMLSGDATSGNSSIFISAEI